MTTSNSSDLAVTATEGAASAPESVTQTSTETAVGAEKTGLESLKAQSQEGKTPAPTPQADVPQSYQPNWKYKVFGKEKELEEFWRPLVKDQDSEKKVKEVFTRAMAFDDLKSKHDMSQGEFQQLLTDYQSLDRDVKKVMQFRNSRDFDNFFKALRISDQEVYEYALNKLKLSEASPEERQRAEQQAIDRSRSYELENEKSNIEQQFQDQAVQVRTMQLDLALSRPDVQRSASAWDERVGQVGAFRNLVIGEAQNAYFSTGKDISAEEATQMVLQKFGKFLEESQAPVQAPQTVQVGTKPVIPTVQGRGTSPIKKAPKSIDDLKAMAREAQAQGR